MVIQPVEARTELAWSMRVKNQRVVARTIVWLDDESDSAPGFARTIRRSWRASMRMVIRNLLMRVSGF
ncbi:hypothetical protein RSSM_00213 [Rhodopirellula sallentina SM41]|uniref:Uncharacterized protein n=1 Tax=Rhodopirellula sallentina SM41 TaxID=1263870 RepID=M5UQS8_9BACT|nr:hypothetical protein RSSM_00213 [Rhodopirellula sallentina SM41]